MTYLTEGGAQMADEEKDTKMSRRRFIRNSSYVAGGAIGGGLLGSFFGPNLLDKNQQPSTKSTQEAGFDRALMYLDRKSTRLNSSHVAISYAVFCLKKKTLKLKQ